MIEDLSWMKVKASQTVAASTTIVLGATIHSLFPLSLLVT